MATDTNPDAVKLLSDDKVGSAVKPDVLDKWLKPMCSRLMYGRCTTLYCLKRGGYSGEPADASIATCEAYESYKALSSHAALREMVYVPKILPDDDEITYRDEAERLLRQNTALREQLAEASNTIRELRGEIQFLRES